jgi:hypothetical protein
MTEALWHGRNYRAVCAMQKAEAKFVSVLYQISFLLEDSERDRAIEGFSADGTEHLKSKSFHY